MKKVIISKSVSFLLILLFLITLSGREWRTFNVLAQSSDKSREAPVNLSHSGAADHPTMVIDHTGRVFVLWHDGYSGLMFSILEEGYWSQPAPGSFPFSPVIPRLFADPNGFIHALWIDEDGRLKSSRVPSNEFSDRMAWSTPHTLAPSVLNFDAFTDLNGNFHAVYILNADTEYFSSGVYYSRAPSGGVGWNTPVPLYRSPYLRTLNKDQSNIKISAGTSSEGNTIYAAWDNQPRKQLLFAVSTDNGRSWQDSVTVENPDSYPELMSLSDLVIVSQGTDLLLSWVTGGSGAGCSQVYRASPDGGNSWGERKTLYEGQSWCPEDLQVIASDLDEAFLAADLSDGVRLIAVKGGEWSLPQPQTTLDRFEDPETYNQVSLGCLQALPTGRAQVAFVGCDQNGGGDVWFINRQIGETSNWFPSSSNWKAPEVIASGKDRTPAPVLLGDKDGRLHVFWYQANENQAGSAIYYARLADEKWMDPTPVYSSPDQVIDRLSAGLDAQGLILIVWHEKNLDHLKVSFTDSEKAINQNEWSKPQLLPSMRGSALSPEILVDEAGKLKIIFAIPVNEDRGIYLIESSDQGKTWSSPFKIFDGVKAGWEMVDRPQIAQTPDGTLHVTWERCSLPGSVNPLLQYYSRSGDGGVTWTEPSEVSSGPVAWSRIIVSDRQTIHRIWQEEANWSALKHQISRDDGLTWEPATSLTLSGKIMGTPGLAVDSAGQIHMVQFLKLDSGSSSVEYWIWNGESWSNEERFSLENATTQVVTEAVLAIAPPGMLNVIYSGTIEASDNGPLSFRMSFASRAIPKEIFSQDPQQPRPVSTQLPTETPLPVLVVSPVPSLTPSPVISHTPQGASDSPLPFIAAAGGLTALSVAGLFTGRKIWRQHRRSKR